MTGTYTSIDDCDYEIILEIIKKEKQYFQVCLNGKVKSNKKTPILEKDLIKRINFGLLILKQNVK